MYFYVNNFVQGMHLNYETGLPEDTYTVDSNIEAMKETCILSVRPIGTEKSYYFVGVMKLGSVNFVLKIRFESTIFDLLMYVQLVALSYGETVETKFLATPGEEAEIQVNVPVVGGTSFGYNAILRYGTLAKGQIAVTLTIKPSDQEDHPGEQIVSKDAVSAHVKEYWTEDRKRQARPRRPRKRTEASGEAASLSQTHAPIPVALSNRVSDPSKPPFAAVGKLFFESGGEYYEGSAVLIGSRTILTAGHNLYWSGAAQPWSENIAFYPQYPNDDAYPVVKMYVIRSFYENDDHSYEIDDVATCLLDVPVAGDIEPLGIWYNQPVKGPWMAVGYPGEPNPPFDGESMWETSGRLVKKDRKTMTMSNNDMGKGGSGGPWLLNVDGRYYINGVNSQKPGDFRSHQDSPIFRNGVYNAWYYARHAL